MIKASLPDMCSVLMIGSPGIGMLEFNIGLAKDYLDAGEAVVFVTMDLLPGNVIALMRSFGIETEKVLGRKLFIIDYHTSLLGATDERDSYSRRGEARRWGTLKASYSMSAEIVNEYGKPVRIFCYTFIAHVVPL